MSMRSSFIYGYGFNSDCDEGKLIDFIKIHKETFCKSDREKRLYEEMIDDAKKECGLEDFFRGYSCNATGNEGIGATIANIMSRETGIRFEYCLPDDSCETPASVVFTEGYPWQLNETEKSLTEEKLKNICKRYMKELNILSEPDYLNLEYYG